MRTTTISRIDEVPEVIGEIEWNRIEQIKIRFGEQEQERKDFLRTTLARG